MLPAPCGGRHGGRRIAQERAEALRPPCRRINAAVVRPPQRVACAIVRYSADDYAKGALDTRRHQIDRHARRAAMLRRLRRRIGQMDETGRYAGALAQRMQGRVHDGIADVNAGAKRHRGGNSSARDRLEYRRDRQSRKVSVGSLRNYRLRVNPAVGFAFGAFVRQVHRDPFDREGGSAAGLTQSEDRRRLGLCNGFGNQLCGAPAIHRQFKRMNRSAPDFLAVQP